MKQLSASCCYVTCNSRCQWFPRAVVCLFKHSHHDPAFAVRTKSACLHGDNLLTVISQQVTSISVSLPCLSFLQTFAKFSWSFCHLKSPSSIVLSLMCAREDERSGEICSPCIVCLGSPSRRNVGTQRKSILIPDCCLFTFTEWYWLSLTSDLPYTLFEWSQTLISVEFDFLGCCAHLRDEEGVWKRELQSDYWITFYM